MFTAQSILSCGDSADGFIAGADIDTFTIDLTEDVSTLTISTCDDFNDFNNTLTLLNASGSIIAFDDDGCGDVGVGRALITTTDISAAQYTLNVGTSGSAIEGVYNVTVFCEFKEPTLAPTTAPNVPRGNISCGDSPLPYVGPGDEEVIYITIPQGTTRFIASTCNEVTDFATRLELQAPNGTVLEADEGTCSKIPNLRASVINTTRPLEGHYILTIRGADLTDSGFVFLTTECVIGFVPIAGPTVEPTVNPTNAPSVDPTPSPTRFAPISSPPTLAPTAGPTPFPTRSPSECPDCPYNVSLKMIGNVTIEQCPTSSPTMRWEYRSDSDSDSSDRRKWKRKSEKLWSDSGDDDSGKGDWWSGNIKCIDSTSSDSEDGQSDDGFMAWYTAKCGDSVDSDDSDSGWRGRRILTAYRSPRGDSGSSDDDTSDSEEGDEDHEFVTEVCMEYDVYNLVQDELWCGALLSVFLGLCENNLTDFNASSIDADDLSKLITSFSPDDGSIESIGGALNEHGDLGILIEFNRDVEHFGLCLGNVTVDSDFNQNKDTINVGDGVAVIQNDGHFEECPADGLLCLSMIVTVRFCVSGSQSDHHH